MMKTVSLLLILIIMSSCFHETSVFSDDKARNSFIKQLDDMYEVKGLTNHFPPSWYTKHKGEYGWSSRYVPCDDDSLYHNFRCSAVFVDPAPLSFIDKIEDTIRYLRKFQFENDSSIKIDIIYMQHSQSYKQISFDTISPPICDFQDADFLLGTKIDSLFNGSYYCKQEYEILPSDLEVYVIEARAGNYWKNRDMAELEARPVLPTKWKHGYSRGIGISRSCGRVCWWVMAW